MSRVTERACAFHIFGLNLLLRLSFHVNFSMLRLEVILKKKKSYRRFLWNEFGFSSYLELELTPKIRILRKHFLRYKNSTFHSEKQLENVRRLFCDSAEVNIEVLVKGKNVCAFL